MSTTPLLEVRNLSKEFPVGSGGILSRKKQIIKVITIWVSI